MKRRERGHAIAGMFVFLLLGVFALSSMLLVLFGAQAYRATTHNTQLHTDSRTLSAYVLNAIRGDDARNRLSLRREGDVDTISVSYQSGGEHFERHIYCWDGWLRELLTLEGDEFDPTLGEELCEAEGMRASLDGSLLTVELTDAQGQVHKVCAALRSVR